MSINLAELHRLAEKAAIEARKGPCSGDAYKHWRNLADALSPEVVKALIGAITNLHIEFMAGAGGETIREKDEHFRWVLAQHGIELGEIK